MVNWLRSRLRAWLGIEQLAGGVESRSFENGSLQAQITTLQRELDKFRAALKAKAAQAPAHPVYTDYESSQQAVLADFEEKTNGVSS